LHDNPKDYISQSTWDWGELISKQSHSLHVPPEVHEHFLPVGFIFDWQYDNGSELGEIY
jgi:hypothetical protein